jgi:hypothetical protein
VKPFETFYKAEDYHQDDYLNNPGLPHCAAVISPELRRLHTLFSDKLGQAGSTRPLPDFTALVGVFSPAPASSRRSSYACEAAPTHTALFCWYR